MINIRHAEARDLEALYAVSLATGLAGADASHLYEDPKMMGHIYVAPYALLEPGLALIVEDHEGLAGFVVGTVDTVAWERRLEREWWPALRARYADPTGAPAALWTPDQRRAFMIHQPPRTPVSVTDDYAAHLHLNLLPRVQRRGVGSQLFGAWLDVAASRGAQTVHVGVNRANVGAMQFWAKQKFKELALRGVAEGRTLWLGRG